MSFSGLMKSVNDTLFSRHPFPSSGDSAAVLDITAIQKANDEVEFAVAFACL
jgi:hypothetical protein